jgi:hypothetical protein
MRFFGQFPLWENIETLFENDLPLGLFSSFKYNCASSKWVGEKCGLRDNAFCKKSLA